MESLNTLTGIPGAVKLAVFDHKLRLNEVELGTKILKKHGPEVFAYFLHYREELARPPAQPELHGPSRPEHDQ
jgi:hypothetical protein